MIPWSDIEDIISEAGLGADGRGLLGPNCGDMAG